MENRWWFNKLGLILCSLYIILTLLCFYIAYDADNKGNFVFLQLPIVFQLSLLNLLDLSSLLYGWSWVSVYLLIMPPTLLLLTVIGGLLQNLNKR